MTAFDDQQPQEQTRGDKLISQLKRNHVPPGQFRMGTLILLVFGVSVVFATPRMIGWRYESFFTVFWFAIFAGTPTVTLIVASYFPWLKRRNRIRLAGASIFLTIVPVIAYLQWSGNASETLYVLLFTSLFFWIPQVICIGCVWFFLFRNRRK